MKTNNSAKSLLAGAAMAGLLSGAAVRLQAAQPSQAGSTPTLSAGAGQLSDNLVDKSKHDCKGQNDCKGQGGCKSGDNGCKGKNSCKGKGGCSTTGK